MRDITSATAQIVAAQAASGSRTTAEILDLIRQVHSTLAAVDASPVGSVETVQAAAPAVDVEAAAPPVAAVEKLREPFMPVEESITHDRLICLCCGDPVILLARHIKRKHGLSPVEYRHLWKLDRDYPMTSAAYAAQKRDLAVAAGFGQSVRPPARGSKAKVVEAPVQKRLNPAFQGPNSQANLKAARERKREREPQLVD